MLAGGNEKCLLISTEKVASFTAALESVLHMAIIDTIVLGFDTKCGYFFFDVLTNVSPQSY